jgi:hypothetical protein
MMTRVMLMMRPLVIVVIVVRVVMGVMVWVPCSVAVSSSGQGYAGEHHNQKNSHRIFEH